MDTYQEKKILWVTWIIPTTFALILMFFPINMDVLIMMAILGFVAIYIAIFSLLRTPLELKWEKRLFYTILILDSGFSILSVISIMKYNALLLLLFPLHITDVLGLFILTIVSLGAKGFLTVLYLAEMEEVLSKMQIVKSDSGKIELREVKRAKGQQDDTFALFMAGAFIGTIIVILLEVAGIL